MKKKNTRKGLRSDIPGVLALQEKNLYANLSQKQRTAGFVTTPFTIPQLEEIIASEGLFVAEDQGQIIAYAFAGNWDYFSQWGIFQFMIERFPTLKYKDYSISTQNSFQYGPVCIANEYRGKGLLNLLFEEMRLVLAKKYPVSITFINQVNARSTKAHTEKLGWEIVDEFEFMGNHYYGLAFDMSQSVL